MARIHAAALIAALTLAACGGQDDSGPVRMGAADEDLSELAATTASGGANAAKMAALDGASQQFCLARQGGQAQIKRFLDRVAACEAGASQAANRCSSLDVDENRLRSAFESNATVLGVLDRAKQRPWPDCPVIEEAQPAVEAATPEEPSGEAEIIEEEAEE